MASVSGGSIEDVLSAVNSADFEDIVGPIDSELTQNTPKTDPTLQNAQQVGVVSAELSSSGPACGANAALLKNQLVLNSVTATADDRPSQDMVNSVSVSPIALVHLGGPVAAGHGTPANASVSLGASPSLLATSLSSPSGVGGGGSSGVGAPNILSNGPTLVALNAESGTLVVAAGGGSAQSPVPMVNHVANAMNGGLQLGATNAMYNLAKIAAEQQPLVVAPLQSSTSNGISMPTAVASGSMVAGSRTLGTMPLAAPIGTPLKQPQPSYVVNSEVKLEKADEKGAGQPVSTAATAAAAAAALAMSSHSIALVRNTNTVSVPTAMPQQVQIITTANQGRAILPPGQVRIQMPQMAMLAPRPAGGTVTLAPGFNLPPGAMLVRNDQGQLVLVSSIPRVAAPTALTAVNAQQAAQQQSQQQSMISALRPSLMSLPQQLVQAPGVTAPQVLLRPNTVMSAATQQMPQHIMPQSIRLQIPAQTTAQAVSQIQQANTAVTKGHVQQPVQRSPADADNVQKCKNFLSTLIKLATNQAPTVIHNVRNLIQGLIEGQVSPEDFTAQLQEELKSSPQPGLVPFLKKSLPMLRDAHRRGELQIEGIQLPSVTATPVSSAGLVPATVLQMATGPRMVLDPATIRPATHMQPQTAMAAAAAAAAAAAKKPQLSAANQQSQRLAVPRNSTLLLPATLNQPLLQQQQQLLPSPQHHQQQQHQQLLLPQSSAAQQSQLREPTPSPKKQKLGLQEDDDINDVAAMGGVNLTEESKNILATTNADVIGSQHRSCKDEYFLTISALAARVQAAAARKGLRDVTADALALISHATQERIRGLVERVSLVTEHRTELPKTDPRYEPSGSDVKSQLRFLEDLDKLERKRHEDEERERLLRAAKSRSKHEDPEQARLKARAKELQEAEMEEIRKRDANITALAAIGPRKRRHLDDSPGNAASCGVGGLGSVANSGVTTYSSSSHGTAPLRQRTKRVNMRDLTFVMEQDAKLSKSLILFKMRFK